MFLQDAFAAARQAHSPLATTVSVGQRDLSGSQQHGRLRSLSVAGCTEITSAGVLNLLKACSHSLTSLNVSRTAVSTLQQSRWVCAVAHVYINLHVCASELVLPASFCGAC